MPDAGNGIRRAAEEGGLIMVAIDIKSLTVRLAESNGIAAKADIGAVAASLGLVMTVPRCRMATDICCSPSKAS